MDVAYSQLGNCTSRAGYACGKDHRSHEGIFCSNLSGTCDEIEIIPRTCKKSKAIVKTQRKSLPKFQRQAEDALARTRR